MCMSLRKREIDYVFSNSHVIMNGTYDTLTALGFLKESRF